MRTVVKFVSCKVDPDQKEAFSGAQKKWTSISEEQGFRGQIGGWSGKDEDLYASIFSYWKSETELNRFMDTSHNTIVSETKQKETYQSIDVHLYFVDDVLAPGSASNMAISSDISWIRIVEGFFYPSEITRVVEAQRAIWKSGTRDLPGFLGGYSSEYLSDNYQFQLLSFWESKQNLDYYSTNHAISLRDKAKINSFLKAVRTREIKCVKDWTVLPKNTLPI